MRLANQDGRAVLVADGQAYDIERISDGRFGPALDDVLQDWTAFAEAAPGFALRDGVALDPARLGPPLARPRQVFAIGLNYREHVREGGRTEYPEEPVVFTKFLSSLTGPTAEVRLPSEFVDWEVELVCVIGREATGVAPGDAWDHIAAVTAGQDFSERRVQMRGPAPQFSMAKSYPGFSPTGPVLVTVDELADRDAIGLRTTIIRDGAAEVMQDGNTRDMIFDVPTLIAKLSEVVTMHPGDLLFTGTPSGVGNGRDPKVFLRPGWTVVTEIEGIGEMRNTLIG